MALHHLVPQSSIHRLMGMSIITNSDGQDSDENYVSCIGEHYVTSLLKSQGLRHIKIVKITLGLGAMLQEFIYTWGTLDMHSKPLFSTVQ